MKEVEQVRRLREDILVAVCVVVVVCAFGP
jgi:hypothetical protein